MIIGYGADAFVRIALQVAVAVVGIAGAANGQSFVFQLALMSRCNCFNKLYTHLIHMD